MRTSLLWRLQQLLPAFTDARAVRAMLTWPAFSLSSYWIVSSLWKQDIRPQTLIDVGANRGQFTVAALRLFKGITVHAFEPIESCAAQLRQNTRGYHGVYIYDVALGAVCERTAFYINAYSHASSLLRVSHKQRDEFPYVNERETRMIDVSTMDYYFAESMPNAPGLPKPVMLKIDVQGAEKDVLAGGVKTLSQVDYVLLEASFTPMYDGEPLFLEMVEVMKTYKFRFLRPVSMLRSPKSGEILQADILFEKKSDR